MTICAIVAIAENNAIGKDNQLLWHLPNDLKHFRTITSGHTVIMGRKTFDSVGKPLPKRRNIVVTRQQGVQIEGCEVVNSVDEALALCANEDEVFIVGGAEIYKLAMPKTDRIYLTIVHQNFDADAYFPELDMTEWTGTEREEHGVDEKHAIPYTFITLQRR
ncbi:dihydrofolate reductase [Mucilaginibacter myungsuensis]|uniref:Dihydrofolate reductase n=1 Tax=Mucilaginibacter myungsuensis TaxID=649104 RepID=A0A929PWU3_9SPHI|nr:dihydrofolate reductase [Mucilaginibacter myungsuensis]MBE9662494.1 dihydrofolate reductase [Mucilaginibacter myungsuensis]MDN3597913.1 dihydrofolate reductase [Mucilaginibacter myungsuensis]